MKKTLLIFLLNILIANCIKLNPFDEKDHWIGDNDIIYENPQKVENYLNCSLNFDGSVALIKMLPNSLENIKSAKYKIGEIENRHNDMPAKLTIKYLLVSQNSHNNIYGSSHPKICINSDCEESRINNAYKCDGQNNETIVVEKTFYYEKNDVIVLDIYNPPCFRYIDLECHAGLLITDLSIEIPQSNENSMNAGEISAIILVIFMGIVGIGGVIAIAQGWCGNHEYYQN